MMPLIRARVDLLRFVVPSLGRNPALQLRLATRRYTQSLEVDSPESGNALTRGSVTVILWSGIACLRLANLAHISGDSLGTAYWICRG